MVVIIERGGVRYGQLTIQIPLNLKEEAKKRKISLSKFLTKALEAELGAISDVTV